MSMTSYVLWFAEGDNDKARVGGKGANLARLTVAGLRVPPGFTVTTAAYDDFVAGGLRERIDAALHATDLSDADETATNTGALRSAIVAATLPADVEQAIRAAYQQLGADTRVAVRSSGTAEDLAEASFAGMHDTYLDIVGEDEVVDAVRRCWASLWTARAATYRHDKGFDQSAASIAVVVQTMVESDVAGVMFTANPLNSRVDEFVVNAAWGLGEAVVSGLVNPDEYVLARSTLEIKRQTIATKGREIVRAEGSGVVEREVPADRRDAPTLTQELATELGQLGRRVTAHYDGMPQDIEWAIADGELYLLQSRDVTGVELTWDEDIDESMQRHPEQHDDILWTNQWACEFWNGAITPLHYSVRGWMFEFSNEDFRSILGFDDIVAMRTFKYRRGTAYFNTKVDALHYQYVMPKALRAGVIGNVHPDDRQAVIDAPFDVKKYIRALLRSEFLVSGHGLYSWLTHCYSYIDSTTTDPRYHRAGALKGWSDEKLRSLSDAELLRYVDDRIMIISQFNSDQWVGFFNTAPLSLSTLGWILASWYDKNDESAFQDLISGLPKPTRQAQESHALWDLAAGIRDSAAVTALFEGNDAAGFFHAAAESDDPEVKAWNAAYQEFMETNGSRGHADRDFYYDRRSENPVVDYDAFSTILSSGMETTPTEIEERLATKRDAATRRVIAYLERKPLGKLRAQAFRVVLDYVHRFLCLRDDERWWCDWMTMAKKRGFQEIGRRCVERGYLGEDQFYFLARRELEEVLAGRAAQRLVDAKVAGRKAAFDRFLAREEVAPMYLKGSEPLLEDVGDGSLVGTGTSRGTVTARARVVPQLAELGRVQPGDILICNSTDPGWASVFLKIKGLVIETGGMLAHGSCLSREYGIPAVTLFNAMQRIPDGALITVDGNTGRVTVEAEEPSEQAALAQA
jgi:rifampicin phosphotransferase